MHGQWTWFYPQDLNSLCVWNPSRKFAIICLNIGFSLAQNLQFSSPSLTTMRASPSWMDRPGVDMGWLQAVELPKTGQMSCFGPALSASNLWTMWTCGGKSSEGRFEDFDDVLMMFWFGLDVLRYYRYYDWYDCKLMWTALHFDR